MWDKLVFAPGVGPYIRIDWTVNDSNSDLVPDDEPSSTVVDQPRLDYLAASDTLMFDPSNPGLPICQVLLNQGEKVANNMIPRFFPTLQHSAVLQVLKDRCSAFIVPPSPMSVARSRALGSMTLVVP